ncbi:hypothetical protein JTE90_020332 [Oedothorax gibbosus]|uniref:Uncharacterized protein n=1 Tax=Oedothorax gibbosus TaxID=931172 RepID=A0AAV6VQ49_9ARAC|nr:hypothetical protein JTE90_020332 [Oedothorax gibbosus]
MSGVEENKSANAATNDPPGESPPDNPSNAEEYDEPAPENPQILMGLANLHRQSTKLWLQLRIFIRSYQ